MGQLFEKNLTELYKTEISLNGETLSQFERVLSRYSEWTSFKREIRLNSLLDDKKIQFDIDDISEYGFLGDAEVDISLSRTCFLLKSMSFILKSDKIEKLEIKWRVLNTQNGEILKNLLDSDINLDIKMRFKENTFFYFYVDVPELKKEA
jgi:hypothetical protein